MGRRDYAILQLLATYGLRASEIVALRLDDVDWRGAVLHVTQPKVRRPLLLPLLEPVAAALVAYLRDGRPASADRRIFRRRHAPAGPLTGGAVYTLVRNAPFGRRGSRRRTEGRTYSVTHAPPPSCAEARRSRPLGISWGIACPPRPPSTANWRSTICGRWRWRFRSRRCRNDQPTSLFCGPLAPALTAFMERMRMTGTSHVSLVKTLRRLDRYVAQQHPTATTLTQPIVSDWCATSVTCAPHHSVGTAARSRNCVRSSARAIRPPSRSGPCRRPSGNHNPSCRVSCRPSKSPIC